jgi:hypothetical protein
VTVDACLSPDGRTMTVRLPMSFHRRGGRTLIVAPDGSLARPTPRTQTVNALVKALAQAHRWQRMLDSGENATVADLAKGERVNASHASRLLRLTLLAPEVVEEILDGQQSAELKLEMLLQPFPAEWDKLREAFMPHCPETNANVA